MKPKKILLVFAIIFTALTVLFGFETIMFFVGPDDSYAYLDELTYNEGVIEEIIEYNANEKAIRVSGRDFNLGVSLDMVSDVDAFNALKKGDKIKFSLNAHGQEEFEKEADVGVGVITLSIGDTEIIPIDAFGKRNEESRKVAQIMGICGTSIFVLISGLFYLLWFKSVRKYRR